MNMFYPKRSIARYLYPWLNVIFLIDSCKSIRNNNFGRRLGNFRDYGFSVRGTVYVPDESTIFIDNFHYDGIKPDAYFWAGDATSQPSPNGILLPYPQSEGENAYSPPLGAHNGTQIVLKIPVGKTIKDFKWLSVWCIRFTMNYAEVYVPPDLDPPRKRVLPEFKRLSHGLRSGNITILDEKTIYIPELHYDGKGPDAYFLVGNGAEPHQHGTKVPNEAGSLEPLRAYAGIDIELQLPGDLTVHDIDWLAVYCIRYSHNFGHVKIPKYLDVPPALGQTKIYTTSPSAGPEKRKDFSNCREMLSERLQVQWERDGDKVRIEVSATIRIDQYIAFGISGDDRRPEMIGSDVVVVYYDEKNGRFHADDYYISSTSQCDGRTGVCKDEIINGRNDVKLIHGERRHGVTTIIYERPMQTNELINDKPIELNTKTNVIAAIGPLNAQNEPTTHATTDKSTENTFIDFSSENDDTCLSTEEERSSRVWTKSVLRNIKVFHARIGPSGGRKGFPDQNKRPSINLAWYINGKLAPEIYVERGKTYTFIVEGGHVPENLVQYHPLYLTDNPEGAFGAKLGSEQKEQRVFAGVSYDMEEIPLPTAAGRLCQWTAKSNDQNARTFEQFFKNLELRCEPGEPAYLNWTVQEETPNLIYYQSYTHSYMGWKIFVEDEKPDSSRAHISRYATTMILSCYSIQLFISWSVWPVLS